MSDGPVTEGGKAADQARELRRIAGRALELAERAQRELTAVYIALTAVAVIPVPDLLVAVLWGPVVSGAHRG